MLVWIHWIGYAARRYREFATAADGFNYDERRKGPTYMG